jgi:hypothetical protein
MKTYGVWRYSSIILDQLHTWAALIPGKEAEVPTEEQVWWAPDLVWTLWRNEESLSNAGGSNPGRGARCPSLHRLSYRNLSPWATHTCERDSELHVVWYTHWFGRGGRGAHRASSEQCSLAWVLANTLLKYVKIVSFVSHYGQPRGILNVSDSLKGIVMLRPREQGLILINLYREGCMRSAQYQLEPWELSQHLLEDEEKPRKPVSRCPDAGTTSNALGRPCPSSWPLYRLLCTFCWVPLLFLGLYLYHWEQFIEQFHIVKFAAMRFTAQVTSSLSFFKASIWHSEDKLPFVKECFCKQWDFSIRRPSATVARSDVVLLGYFVKSGNSLGRNGDTPSCVSFSKPAYPVCFTGAGSFCVRRSELR